MDLQLRQSALISGKSVSITGSKSESNRLLLLQALYPQLSIEGVSASDDSRVMQKALKASESLIDVHHAGTAMRFLTAYFASRPGVIKTITGSERMRQRPIGILVDALRSMGADIEYLEREGFPPLKIRGQELIQNQIGIRANVSSQFISALLLIAPSLPNGLRLELEGEITSLPYLTLTLGLLSRIGISCRWDDRHIEIEPSRVLAQTIKVESDWSSASYFYSFIALSEIGTRIQISSFREDSLQGDAALMEIYSHFGVRSYFVQDWLHLEKTTQAKSAIEMNLIQNPDLAQTIAVTCLGLGIPCHLTGLHTLKIKETDRLSALKTELEKLGARVEISENSLTLHPCQILEKGIEIATYNDHRMALAFAPLALKTNLIIQSAEVVSKSYPGFFEDLATLGIRIEERPE